MGRSLNLIVSSSWSGEPNMFQACIKISCRFTPHKVTEVTDLNGYTGGLHLWTDTKTFNLFTVAWNSEKLVMEWFLRTLHLATVIGVSTTLDTWLVYCYLVIWPHGNGYTSRLKTLIWLKACKFSVAPTLSCLVVFIYQFSNFSSVFHLCSALLSFLVCLMLPSSKFLICWWHMFVSLFSFQLLLLHAFLLP